MDRTQVEDANIINRVKGYNQANANLMREGFKVETLLGFMNNCADTCHLRYFETGITDANNP